MNSRNGYRDRTWDTRAGIVELKIPKRRQGSYSLSSWNPDARPRTMFPNDSSITRLVGAMMLEQSDEWSLNLRSGS